MELFWTVVLFALGLVLIVKGGDLFVDAAIWVAEAFHIPKFIIGATVVSFATTLPELLVSLMAALEGKVDMAVGNAVGSVTANTGLIMGVSVVCIPAIVQRKSLGVSGGLMLLSAALLLLFSQSGALSLAPSLALLLIFVLYQIYSALTAKKLLANENNETGKQGVPRREIVANIVKFALGTAGIVIGAQLLVDKGSALARLFGVPESIIGVTLVAVGTSLPELVTTVTAIVKKQANLSIGNIIGANIIDLTMILPLCTIFSGKALPFAAQSVRLDLPVCLLVGVLAIVPAFLSKRFRRWQGVAMLAMYGGYLTVLCTGVWQRLL